MLDLSSPSTRIEIRFSGCQSCIFKCTCPPDHQIIKVLYPHILDNPQTIKVLYPHILDTGV